MMEPSGCISSSATIDEYIGDIGDFGGKGTPDGDAPAEDRNILILVADDDEDILSLISVSLQRADHEVVTAKDGEEALELIFARRPDLALLDVRMPRLTGHDVVRRIRESQETHGIPVILVSADANEQSIVDGLEEGADDYLTKPFSPNELIRRTEDALTARERVTVN